MEFRKSYNVVDYPDALATMEERVDRLRNRSEDSRSIEELVWFLEHPPLYTAGTSAKAGDLLDQRFPVFQTGRGGQYTYHGPGQRVAYLMLDLKKRQSQPDIKYYIWQLEEVIIRTLGDLGIEGHRRDGRVGIWVVDGATESKIAAIGVRVRHWVTFHGLSINNNPDLSHFDGIVPCGIQEHGVTSLEKQGVAIEMNALDGLLEGHIQEVFEMSDLSAQAAL